jgi:excisionase family DNA binding protein
MDNSNNVRKLLTRREVAQILGISIRTVDRIARSGLLVKVAIGGRMQVTAESVERLIQSGSPVREG